MADIYLHIDARMADYMQVQAESLPRGGRLRAAAHRRRGPAGGCEDRAGACVRALTADGVLAMHMRGLCLYGKTIAVYMVLERAAALARAS